MGEKAGAAAKYFESQNGPELSSHRLRAMNVRYWRKSRGNTFSRISDDAIIKTLTTPPLARDAVKKRRQGRRRKILFWLRGRSAPSDYRADRRRQTREANPGDNRKGGSPHHSADRLRHGKVQPETEVKISPEVTGEITELPVEDGMQVKKGDLLLKIKPDSYKALLEQQEAAIGAAEDNSEQKATMLKTEHDLRRSKELVREKADFRSGIQCRRKQRPT